MSSISLDEGYLVVEDPNAESHEDCFIDHEGSYRRVHVFYLSVPLKREIRKAIEADPEKFRTPLHKRPGVKKGGLFLPMAWEEWDRFRNMAWEGT